MKKIFALVLAMMMVAGMVSAFASGTITINRDSSWQAGADNADATYTYYKIFDAKDIDQEVGLDGAQTADSNATAVYSVDSLAKAQALPSIFKVGGKAPSAVTAADAADDGLFYVELAGSTGAADIAAALKTMVEANTTLFPGTSVTSDDNPVVLPETGTLADGYYLIVASNGSVLAVQTLDDVEINEKNDYPTIDKKQSETESSYADDELEVKVGSTIYYEVTVHIPETANKDIVVVDKMTEGLTYDSTAGLTFDPAAIQHSEVAATDVGYDADADWQIKFTPTQYADYLGQDIVITFCATVNSAALTDTGRENEVTLTYDNGNYVLHDEVNYTTYFAGIYKIDPDNSDANMAGVKFELKDGDGNPVTVTYDSTNKYYTVDPASNSNEVETASITVGTETFYGIRIRGLDGDVTYTLTETETKTGYNLLNSDVTLTKFEDEGDAFSTTAVQTTNHFDRVENKKGSILPSTGGIGTTIFYVGGGLLVLVAVIFLVTKRRMGSND